MARWWAGELFAVERERKERWKQLEKRLRTLYTRRNDFDWSNGGIRELQRENMAVLSFFICIVATAVGAISGVGGGVIIKPVFDAVSGLPVATISFLSGCTVLGMTVVSLFSARGGEVKIETKRGTLLAVGGALGGILGKLLFDWIKANSGNDGLVGSIQSVAMVCLTVGVFVYMLLRPRIKTLNLKNGGMCLLIGLGLGVLSSFLGIGGGPINLVVLHYFFSMDTKTAALNSLYIIFFSQGTSLASALIQQKVPSFDSVTLLVMVAGGVAGGLLGRKIAKKLSTAGTDRVFYVLLLVITAISGYNLVHYASMI